MLLVLDQVILFNRLNSCRWIENNFKNYYLSKSKIYLCGHFDIKLQFKIDSEFGRRTGG